MICSSENERIGGEFELHPGELADAPCATQPSFGRAHEFWTDTGRSALALAAREILRRGGQRRAWLPAYCCEAIVRAFGAAGFETIYYSVGEALRLAVDPPVPLPGETLLFIHYFGHRNDAMRTHAESLRSRGVWIIEDCVQAGLSAGVGRTGHFAVASYRKLLPQPDGALLGADSHVTCDLQPSSERSISQRLLGKLLRGAKTEDAVFLRLLAGAEAVLEEQVAPREPSWIGAYVMARTNREAAGQRRRANWCALSERLDALGGRIPVIPLFTTLQPGEVPLGLAVRVAADRRDVLRAFLAQHAIYCPVHWPLAHVPATPQFRTEHELARAILTLPIDQRMDQRHIERFAAVLGKFFGVRS